MGGSFGLILFVEKGEEAAAATAHSDDAICGERGFGMQIRQGFTQ
jgi:hypothetical protein